VHQRAVCVDRGRSVAREQLEREQSRAAGRRAIVLEPAAQELELLSKAKLTDRTVGDRPLAEVGAARRSLELVVPLRSKRGELPLGAGRGQLVGLGGR
jgi:hypothetical protein